jgi:hypothetical protein
MSLIKGKQIAVAPDGIATANINANAVTSAKVDSTIFLSSGANPLTGDANAGAHKITNLAAPTLGTDAARLQDVTANVPKGVTANKNMTAAATVADGDSATATAVASPNAIGGYFGVRVNGINYVVGDGTKINVDCYVSGDGGVTARAMAAIIAGDTLRWNGSIAGFQLATTDRVDFVYEALP